jgi:type IV secretion system protein TrbD
MSLRLTPIHRAGHRSNLFLGADRQLMFWACIVSAGFFLSFTLLGIIASPIFLMSSHKLLRKAAAADPNLRTVYWRYLWQASFYPARSQPHRLRKLPKGIFAPWT